MRRTKIPTVQKGMQRIRSLSPTPEPCPLSTHLLPHPAKQALVLPSGISLFLGEYYMLIRCLMEPMDKVGKCVKKKTEDEKETTSIEIWFCL